MKIVLVTGGNRGIGFEICRQLDQLGHTVILGSRDFSKGQEAAKSLSDHVIVRQLDVTNEGTIQNLNEYLNITYGRLDVLINNAGIWTSHSGYETGILSNTRKTAEKFVPFAHQIIRASIPILRKMHLVPPRKNVKDVSLQDVKQIMETNLYGAWRMSQVFVPLLMKSENGRIINISSGMGELKSLTGDYPAYRLSKASLNAMTIMFANELLQARIQVNAVDPGWVRTDMGGLNAPRSISEGADTAVWLATEENIRTGKFFHDRKEIDW